MYKKPILFLNHNAFVTNVQNSHAFTTESMGIIQKLMN